MFKTKAKIKAEKEREAKAENAKKPAEARWRVIFWRQGRRFNMLCEHLCFSTQRHRGGNDGGYIELQNILEAPLDDVGYDVCVTIDNLIKITRLDQGKEETK